MEYLLVSIIAVVCFMFLFFIISFTCHMIDSMIFDGKLTPKFKRWAQSKVGIE